ncbi:hypothetical protein [Scytonema sp. PRP1]|uniref:hypothetical protein n=1 Tax=Scytonema sp. PRP1 TaxID=3120513 RepID=UPI00300CEA94
MTFTKTSLLLTVSIVLSAIPVYANNMELLPEDTAFCSDVRDYRMEEVISQSSVTSNSGGNVNLIVKIPIGAKFNHKYNRSTASSHEVMSEYQSKNCDELLRQAGQVTIAKINANASVAIAEIERDKEKYSADTRRIIAEIDAKTKEKLAQIQRGIEQDTNKTGLWTGVIREVGNFFGNMWDYKKRNRELATQERLAALAADPNLALIQNWGLTTASCGSSVVSILIDGKEYCTKPVKGLSVGSYTYIRAEGRLEPISQSSNSLNATNSNPQPTPEPISQSPNLVNTNTNSNPQPTPETGL